MIQVRTARTPEEHMALDAGLDTLIHLAMEKIGEERNYKDAIHRGNDPILLELSSMVKE